MSKEEWFPLIDEQGRVIGKATRQECHNGSKLLHPVVHLHILNRHGDLYLQKRSMSKDIQPGKWDTAVGGHVDYGEHIEEALAREGAKSWALRNSPHTRQLPISSSRPVNVKWYMPTIPATTAP